MGWISRLKLLRVSKDSWRALAGNSRISWCTIGSEVIYPLSLVPLALTSYLLDANVFYHLESWRESTSDPYTTVYLSQIRIFQRQMTTGAFKIAGGVDLSGYSAPTSRLAKQNSISSMFVSKITKAFLDTLYAFLDGLVHLASDESPETDTWQPKTDITGLTATNSLELLDIHNAVRRRRYFY